MAELLKREVAKQTLTVGDSADNKKELVEKYARLVHSVPVRHGLATDEVEDVAQDVFTALAKNLHQIKNPDALPGWLVTTARRLSWRAVQKSRREAPVDGDSLSVMAETRSTVLHISQMPTMSELIDGWGRQELLAQGFQHLGERCRDLLTMIFLAPEEPSYEKISQELGISKGSIGPTRNRCLEKLREILIGRAD